MSVHDGLTDELGAEWEVNSGNDEKARERERKHTIDINLNNWKILSTNCF